MSPISTLTQRRSCSHATSTINSASNSTEMPTNTRMKSRAVRCRRSTKLKSYSITTRNGVGSAASKSKRDTCTEPEGSCTMRVAAGLALAVRLARDRRGVRSVLTMVVPSGRHTSTASRRSSAVILAR